MITIKSVSGRELYVAETAADVRAALVEAVASRADLRGANLRGADLRGANLWGANLREADLWGANLRGADLRGANLWGANLREADLRGANLRGADLRGANLREADLRGADLRGADMWGADSARLNILPEGALIGWKKARSGEMVKLRIPEDAKRSNATGRKCRTERAEIIAIYLADGTETEAARSSHDSEFIYRVGETVTPTQPFNEDRWQECATGIHFFITREEAQEY